MIRSEVIGDFFDVFSTNKRGVRIRLRSMTQTLSSQTEVLFLAQTNCKAKESYKPVFCSGQTHIDNYFSQSAYSSPETDIDQLSILSSINTITGQQIQDRAATDLQKSLQYMPGLTAR
jgi:hypothetical protein